MNCPVASSFRSRCDTKKNQMKITKRRACVICLKIPFLIPLLTCFIRVYTLLDLGKIYNTKFKANKSCLIKVVTGLIWKQGES